MNQVELFILLLFSKKSNSHLNISLLISSVGFRWWRWTWRRQPSSEKVRNVVRSRADIYRLQALFWPSSWQAVVARQTKYFHHFKERSAKRSEMAMTSPSPSSSACQRACVNDQEKRDLSSTKSLTLLFILSNVFPMALSKLRRIMRLYFSLFLCVDTTVESSSQRKAKPCDISVKLAMFCSYNQNTLTVLSRCWARHWK